LTGSGSETTTTKRTIKPGWNGRFLEDFTPGDVFKHVLGRTVTATDNASFTLLTQNTAPLHFDANYATHTSFGKPLVNSAFTIALVSGQTVSDVSQNVFANLGWDKVRMPHPVFEGDTLYSETEVLDVRELEITSGRWHRHGKDRRLQPEWRRRHHIRAYPSGLSTWPRPFRPSQAQAPPAIAVLSENRLRRRQSNHRKAQRQERSWISSEIARRSASSCRARIRSCSRSASS
jgi:acyl dehydratase